MSLVGKPGFRETEVGWIPEDWQPSTLGGAAYINPSRTKPESDEDEVSFLAMGDVSEDGRVITRQVRIYAEVAKGFTSFIDNDVLVAKITPCFENGKGALVTNLLGGIGLGSTEFHVVRAKTDRATPAFLNSHTRSDAFRRLGERSMVGSAGQKRVPAEFLREYPVALPPLPEQQKIAAILTAVDDKLDVIARQIEVTQTLKHGLMQGLFKRGVGLHNAADWPTVLLCEVADVRTGVAKGKKGLKEPVELPYLRVANVQDGHIDLSEVKSIEVEATQVERFRLRPGDVLMTEGGDFDKLGRGDVWEGQISPCLHQNHVFAVRPQPGKLNSHYLAALAASDHGRQYFLSCAKRTTNLASINSSQLKAFPVLLPSIAVQESIAEIVHSANAKVAVLEEKQKRHQTLKRGLMQKLLTGEWRVSLNASATGT